MPVLFRRLRGLIGLLGAALALVGAVPAAGQNGGAELPAPVLLVTSSAAPNPYGPYLGEILRTEGVMSFDSRDIASVGGGLLQQYAVVLLAEMPLAPAQADALTGYVAGGGHLIAMRPDAQLDDVCGWSPASGQLADGYVQIAADAAAGAGLPGARLQFHGPAALHAESAHAIASLSETGWSDPAGVAVSLANARAGGAASCWAYDLAQSVVLTRQGNPANADVDVDGDGVFRTIDLFQAKGGAAPWIDRDHLGIPQADEQMRLLTRLVEDLGARSAPLPRLWYFPEGALTMLILTGDGHANPISYYQKELDSLRAHGGTITLFLSAAGEPNDDTVQRWRAQGHDVGIHPYVSRPDPSPALAITSLEQGYDVFAKWFASSFKSPMSRVVRNHQVAWKGWTDAAEIEAAHHIALDADFYHWGTWLRRPDGSWLHGYITGSGLPMKFARADGAILPVYQQLTELADEQLIKGVGFGFEELGATGALEVSRRMIDASLAGDYAALMTQFHVDTYGYGDPQVWAEGTLDYARAKGVPIWNAGQWLAFTEARHDAQIGAVRWDATSGRLAFTLRSSAATTHTLTLMLPASPALGALTEVAVDRAPQKLAIQTIKGRQYAFVAVAPGNREVVATYAAAESQRLAGAAILSAASRYWPVEAAVLLFGVVLLLVARGRAFTALLGRLRQPTTSRPTLRRRPERHPRRPTDAPAQPPEPRSPPRARWTIGRTRRSTLTVAGVEDFAGPGVAGPVFTNTTVSQEANGEICLKAELEDYFRTNQLNGALWTAGRSLIGTPNITIAAGKLRITSTLTGGGFVRSIDGQRYGVLEGVVTFGAGEDQHFGWAAPALASDQYAMFSTGHTSDTLFVRTNNLGDEQQTAVGALKGVLRLRIEWAEAAGHDLIRYYVNGALVAAHQVHQLPTLYVHLLNNSLGGQPLSAEWIRCTPYAAATGTYLSKPIAVQPDQEQVWGPIGVDAAVPPGTSLTVDVRTSNDFINWSDFSTVASADSPNVPAGVYLQYRVTLTTTADRMVAPRLNAISIGHAPCTLGPTKERCV
jgi:hypothetical protein